MMNKYLLLFCACGFSFAGAQNTDFSGNWSYRSHFCDHTAADGSLGVYDIQLNLKQKGNRVSGTWDSGSSPGTGESGKLVGTVKGNKLFVRYCTDNGSLPHTCPRYKKTEEQFFLHEGDHLTRYFIQPNKVPVKDTTEALYKNGKIPHHKIVKPQASECKG